MIDKLPNFCVKEDPPFTGVDFAGLLFVRAEILNETQKVWICLYTCCVVRAISLDLVPDLTTMPSCVAKAFHRT